MWKVSLSWVWGRRVGVRRRGIGILGVIFEWVSIEEVGIFRFF